METPPYLAGMPRFAALLRALREDELGLTQKEFARRVGMSQARVSTYESGDQRPSRAVVERIAKTFNRDPRDLDPNQEAYTPAAPRRRADADSERTQARKHLKEVTVDDARRFEFVSLFDSLIRDPDAQEELVTLARRFVARKLGNG